VIERLDRFMARANTAYYGECDPFADFTTAPEISQVFGEILGLWALIVWRMMGQPAAFLLVEAGPGKGTLMADALRAAGRADAGFAAALALHFVEFSPRLRAILRAKFPAALFHDTLDSLPPGPMILLANEFLDALPIRQFVRRESGWMERFVDQGEFVEQPSPISLPDDAPGSVRELNEASLAVVANLTARLVGQGGAALFIDYGSAQSGCGDSLQALHGGTPSDPLRHAGLGDITAHVDFASLAAAARQAQGLVHGPVRQGRFLLELGIIQRTQALARHMADWRGAADLQQASQRLIGPEAMGSLFKVMAVSHPSLTGLPGFAA
jgi:SAM-dependent MidA family methyltransferase